MEERMIMIDQQHYEDLVRRSERLAIIERIFESGKFVPDKDVKLILGLTEGGV